jgi:hypothetical protein
VRMSQFISRLIVIDRNHSMSGELGAYDIVVGNMGDRNDLNLWWKGGSLVSV